MFNYIHSTTHSQDTDPLIVDMVSEMLADEDLYIFLGSGIWYLVEKTDDTFKVIDEYETRVAAYRAGLDCVIEACIDAWEKGDEE